MSSPNKYDRSDNIPADFDSDYEQERDPGDSVLCGGCHEWVLPEIKTEINTDIHQVMELEICPCCGDVLGGGL
jgi:hypothetical protein